MKKDSGSLKMGAERTRSGFNARFLWSWLLADEDEQNGQPDASDVRRHPWKAAASFVAAAALVVAFFWYSLAQIDYRPGFSFLPDFRMRTATASLQLQVSADDRCECSGHGAFAPARHSLGGGQAFPRASASRPLEPLCGLYPRDASHHADLPFFLSGRDSMGC